MKKYDVIIIGAGPSGIFTALELLNSKEKPSILIIEKGKDIEERACPVKVKNISCTACRECDLLSGWGGAGAFSDGKLSLSPEVGGFLSRYIDKDKVRSLIDYVDGIYLKYGAPSEVFGDKAEEVMELEKLSSVNNLVLIPSKIRHIGTDRCKMLLKRIREDIRNSVDTIFQTEAEAVLVEGGKYKGVKLKDGTEFLSDFLVLAPGREGSRWLEEESRRLGLTLLKNPVDIGVRVELPATVLEPLTRVTYEPKLLFYSRRFDDKVRTFCVNPYGEVVKEYLKGIWTVNGHSYADRRTANTNFAILVSTYFTEPFDQPISYGRYIAQLANFLGKGVIVQRLGDLMAGRRSTQERISKGIVRPTLADATPGDLSFVIPYRYLCDIMEMLEALDKIAPGVNSRHTLLYGVEVKFYSMQLKLTDRLETEISNIFAVGDGAGVSRGLIQASASGILAAREILCRS
ncbi:Glucose inhibited division protein A [Candidatus Sulfobium mesophilum]|uniref:Glucose inhibited division protein A n=1 Tax=Candidatus Sulfobium mesophilum TaxID=2016548 RepID=A0A2U3QFJ4_9BACT|nr:Glucose inhibited division protein A [Candidatus Sulfobium mesophilum]